jgi:predicted transcriptional regulator
MQWSGDRRDVREVTVVPKGMWRYREEAVDEVYSLRSDGVRRVLYADAVVRFVADREGVEVGEFIEGLEAADLGRLVEEYGVRMFPENSDVIDVSERTRADVMSALRYFRGL